MARYLYLDLESTGYAPREIVQLSYILCEDNTIVSHLDKYFRLNKTMDAAAYMVHGLSERRLNGLAKITFEDYIDELIPVVASCDYIVGHNISFDVGCMLDYNNEHLNSVLSSKLQICTMKDYLRQLGTEIMSDSGSALAWTSLTHTIANMINRFGFDSEELTSTYVQMFGKKPKAHDGLFDTYLVYRIHQHLMGHLDVN